MAFMNQERKAQIAPVVKAILKKYKMKGTLSVRHHMSLVLNISSGAIKFDQPEFRVNVYHIDSHYTCVAKNFFKEVYLAMNTGNHDNSDIMVDYFDVGWYTDISVGKWNKPYTPV
jgi:hypothetical protein